MDEHSENWRNYYQKAMSRRHNLRTEKARSLTTSNLRVAVDCGCGTGSDIDYLSQFGWQVYGFDVNPDAVSLCHERFSDRALIDVIQSSFENYDYPNAGIVLAHNSLFFADPRHFDNMWRKLAGSIECGGVFVGDFMGVDDSWAERYRSPVTALTQSQVEALFADFDIIEFNERREHAQTALGHMKFWHTYSVIAVKVGG
uniref:class I SAM-dependent methyltransferase n=1 Tax=Thaumasiovibrio occultus TaxID=1891184 RepID=UPI000B35D841|nr:class I SAM-dependent methyltransferase [Thaumasiovibrio occultus]